MNVVSRDMERLGFDAWFNERVDAERAGEFELARVIAVHKGSYVISRGGKDVFAELIGKMLYGAGSPLDLPAVGDWVYASFYDGDDHAIIHGVLPRKTLLKRKTPGKRVEFQLIAANVDVAFIVQSLNENFNVRRLERYLVMANESRIRPVVLLSKSDLLSTGEVGEKVREIEAVMPDLQVLDFSNEDESGLKGVWDALQPGLTYCLLGSSGVGKTTLLNNLIGESRFDTRTVSRKESKGRHTTTSRQLIRLDCGAMLVDTPGMRELGNFLTEGGLGETFSEIRELSTRCRFKDCTHVTEKGCAVLKALEEGRLSEERYESYIKMSRESAYNEMSYLEKRRKDREFGKLIKSVQQQHRKSRR